MSDPVFAPTKKPAGAVAPGNAQLVYVREILFAIKGVYQDPLAADAVDAPLPPHRWALVEPGEKIFVEGTTSDATGVSTVPAPDGSKTTADTDWDLWLVPIYEDQSSSADVVEYGEVWIDVDKKQWVRPKDVQDLARIESRRLLRLPRWTSFRHKVAFQGTFRELLPGSSEFEQRGRIKHGELKPHGTPDKPWTIAIDEGLLRTFVQFRFYDPVQRKERAVPKGLVVEAQGIGKTADGDELGPFRVGVSSVRRDDGSIYILHARAEASSTDLHYRFDTPEHTTFAYADGAFTSTKLDDLARLEKEYPVTKQWHSLGHEAWEGAVDASATVRKKFDTIRTKGTTAKKPICFHLDDLVLTFLQTPSTVDAKHKRMGIYTTLAKLRDPVKKGGKDLPYGTLQASSLLRAEAAMFVRDKGFEECTRFIEWEGELHEVSTQFVFGFAGTTERVGARAADRVDPLEDNASIASGHMFAGHRVYLLDTRWVKHVHDKVTGRLAHLVCYVSSWIDNEPDPDPAKKNTKNLNVKNLDALDILASELVMASDRWDQKHPGIPSNNSLKKDYVIIREKNFATDSTILKVRHVFGMRTNKEAQPIVIQVDTGPGRATGGNPMRLYCQWGDKTNAVQDPDWLTNSAADLMKTAGGKQLPTARYNFQTHADDGGGDRLDGAKFPWSTFAHELGHEAGLFDEYLDGIDTALIDKDINVPKVPNFDNVARPYYMDTLAFMNQNQIPRIRYVYNYLDAIHRNASKFPSGHWVYGEAPFVAQYIAGSRKLTHAVPRDISWNAVHGGPWHRKAGTQGLCEITFFPTSHDEGMIGPCVLPSGLIKEGEEFDGVLVLSPKVWVSFDASVRGDDARKFKGLAEWSQLYYDHSSTPHFAIVTPAAPTAKRVVVVFQPRFEYGPKPTAGQTTADATVELRLRRGGGAPTYSNASTPPLLTCALRDIGPWIFRYLLRAPKTGPTPPGLAPVASKDPTTAADLGMLPSALSTLLGRAEVGTVVAYKAGA
ncbi:MAG: hypothetical protein ACKV2T_38845 [Kofleriaceae bacterium]